MGTIGMHDLVLILPDLGDAPHGATPGCRRDKANPARPCQGY
ncbi:hypothetical protein SXCC_03197 [Gluconacetobacter sp. SXCC-1]|nr:hypothetical protein SXCC_03197 [Gluconacetobacter sp. SXCC-1]